MRYVEYNIHEGLPELKKAVLVSDDRRPAQVHLTAIWVQSHHEDEDHAHGFAPLSDVTLMTAGGLMRVEEREDALGAVGASGGLESWLLRILENI